MIKYLFFTFLNVIFSCTMIAQYKCRLPLTADSALSGKIDGLIMSTPTPNAPAIRIRCAATVMGEAPLYVIDGVLIEQVQLAHLNPNDIESIDILKDAAATALYGCRGARGVLIITTKKKEQVLRVIDSASGEAVAYASVRLYTASGTPMQLVADSTGMVRISASRLAVVNTIEVSSVGYQQRKVKAVNGKWGPLLPIAQRKNICHGVVVVSIPETRRRCGYRCRRKVVVPGEELPGKIAAVTHNVYPNPTRRGTAINFSYSNAIEGGSYVEWVSAAGQITAVQRLPATAVPQTIQISTGQQAAGVYFVLLKNAQGQLLAKSRVVVQ
jgi:TonB-dependent SusC/RagA subfamily outer membrane receptor